jgi:RTX calcium-binding nonapeptide repeat (4 copies)
LRDDEYMQGVGSRRSPRGVRAAILAAVLCITALALPAGAAAHVSSEVVSGTLIARSDGAADIIKVSCGADLQLKVNGLDPTQGAASCSAIRGVRVLGNGGPDTVNVTRVGPRNGFGNEALLRPRAVQCFGGPSSDRISGSRLSDLLSGGDGHDVLRGRAGADLLRGGGGSDRLLGGLGPDRLIGGPGRDFLRGGRGNDVLVDL